MEQPQNLQLTDLIGTVEIKGMKKLAFFTGQESKVFSQTDFVKVKRDGGFFQGNAGEIHDWKLEGTTEQDGRLIFYGPWLDAETLPEDFNPSADEFSQLRDFLCYLSQFREICFSPFHFLRIKEGGFLQLPPLLVEELLKSCLGLYNPIIRRYSHPDLQGEQDLCFSLAVLQFRRLTGSYPWLEKELEPLNHEIRERKLPWLPNYYKGEEKLLLIERSLRQSVPEASLEEWKEFSPMEYQEALPGWVSVMEKSYLAFERKRNLMRYRGRYILSGAGMAVVLLLVIQGIINFFSPPFTEGMTRREIAELFYTSLTHMDTETTGELSLKQRHIDPQKELDFIFVTNRVRQATEGDIVNFTPQSWMEESRKPLAMNEIIYGVSQLELTPMEDGSIEAEYLLWGMPIGEDSDRMPDVEKTRDIIRFSQKKDSWFIESISTEERVPVPIPE